jgi:hypothetical protein
MSAVLNLVPTVHWTEGALVSRSGTLSPIRLDTEESSIMFYIIQSILYMLRDSHNP